MNVGHVKHYCPFTRSSFCNILQTLRTFHKECWFFSVVWKGLKTSSWKKRSRKDLACIVSTPLVSCLWGCGESVNPPKWNHTPMQMSITLNKRQYKPVVNKSIQNCCAVFILREKTKHWAFILIHKSLSWFHFQNVNIQQPFVLKKSQKESDKSNIWERMIFQLGPVSPRDRNTNFYTPIGWFLHGAYLHTWCILADWLLSPMHMITFCPIYAIYE